MDVARAATCGAARYLTMPSLALVMVLALLSSSLAVTVVRADGPAVISAMPPAGTTAGSPSLSEEELRRKLAAAERRIEELERQLQERDRTASLEPTAASPDAGASQPAPPAVSLPTPVVPPARPTTADAKVAQAAGSPSAPAALEAMEEELPSWFPKVLGAQWNVINQNQFPFHSPYSGPNSLNQDGDNKTSQTRSVYLGAQLDENLQAYLDLEWFVGNGIHGGTGAGGFPNGDVVRAGPADLPKDPYVARAYGRYVVPLSGGTAVVSRAQDRLPGHEPTDYLFIKAGHFAVTDDFDTNRYANSVRTQFMNFALINNGAFDFAADTRGYSNGLTVGWVEPDWSIKLGTFLEPKHANGEDLDFAFANAQGSQAELAWKPFANDTVVRFLAYANQANMGNYEEALQIARATGSTPSISADDKTGRWKYGFGLNMEVPLADKGNTGLFLRAGWNDGHTETWAFTEIDRTVTVGGQLSGAHWGRDDDWVGVGLAVNGLSTSHKNYLAAGGTGFMIGDGRLNYAPETILEMYYSFAVNDYIRLSPDYQYILNPAYNSDRGPVNVASIRARAAF